MFCVQMCCAVIMRYMKQNLVEKLTYTRTEYLQTYTIHEKIVANLFRNMNKRVCDKITVACLHTKAPKGQLGVSLFWLISCYICHQCQTVGRIILLLCEPPPCHALVWPLFSAFDAWDRVQTHPRCETAHRNSGTLNRLRILLLQAFDQLLIP